MLIGIIGIVLGLIAIGLVFYYNKDQNLSNDFIEGDAHNLGRALLALQEEFIEYQVNNERKIKELENVMEVKSRNMDYNILKFKSELPMEIKKVIGPIEFAQPGYKQVMKNK